MAITLKTKLAFKDAGNPKKVLGSLDEVKDAAGVVSKHAETERKIGSVVGLASAVIERKNLAGEVLEGLAGQFELTRYSDGEVLQSGVLYLPSGMQEMFHSRLKDEFDAKTGQVTKEADANITFAFEIILAAASNAQGYEWRMRSLLEAAPMDPLAQLREQTAKALAPPAGSSVSGPAPEASAGSSGSAPAKGRKAA